MKSRFSLNLEPFSYSQSRQFDSRYSDWYTNRSLSSSGTFSISQPIIWTDATLSLNNSLSWQNNESTIGGTTNSNRAFSNRLYLSLTQPIFTYNRTKMNMRQIEMNYENARISYALQRLNVERNITSQFYSLTDVSLFHRLANSRYSLLPWRIAAAVFIAGGLYAGYRHVHLYKVDERYRADMVKLDNDYVHKGGAVAKSCELNVTQMGDSLSVIADMTVSPRENTSQLVFTLNPGFRVNSISAPGYSMEYERLMHLVILSFDKTLPKDQPVNIVMDYSGKADDRICYLDISSEKMIENIKALSMLNVSKCYLFQDRDYTMLTPESYWYPRPGVAYSDQSPEWQMSYFTDFVVNVTPNPGLTPISQGLCIANDDSTRYTFKPESSLPSISLMIGDYTPPENPVC